MDIEEGAENRGKTSRKATEDYEKINSQMEEFNSQKKNFMAKINSFAEKMKILWLFFIILSVTHNLSIDIAPI